MVKPHDVRRFDVYWVALDPTLGSEIKKTRPCLIISPDEMNRQIKTIIIAPLTSTIRPYPTRITASFKGKKGQIVLDQIRTVDKKRLIQRMGTLSEETQNKVLRVLRNMFSR